MACLYPSTLACRLTPSSTFVPTGVGEVAFWDTTGTLGGETAFTYTAATNNLSIGGGLVVNEDGGAAATDDFRVESATRTHMLFVNADNESISFGAAGTGVEGNFEFFDPADGLTSFLALRNSVGGGAVFNQDAADLDFRVESVNQPFMIAVDAANDTLSCGPGLTTASWFYVSSTFVEVNALQSNVDFRARANVQSNALWVDASADQVHIMGQNGTCVFNAASMVVNELGADIDFRVEGDTLPHLFKVDAGSDTVAIGSRTSVPQTLLHVADSNTSFPTLNSGAYIGVMGTAAARARLALCTSTTGFSTIEFGDTADIDAGFVQYDHTNDLLRLAAGTVAGITMFSDRKLLLRSTNSATVAGDGWVEIEVGSAAGVPALLIDQDDVDEPIFKFEATSGADVTSTISTHGTAGSLAGWVQIDVNGSKRWIPFYNDPSA